jgi:hypothetical protein
MKRITKARVESLARKLYNNSDVQAVSSQGWSWREEQSYWRAVARAALEILKDDFEVEYTAGRFEGMRQAAEADGRYEDARDLAKGGRDYEG